jgi:succinoglycan biosynthesis transport protein ExoP
MQDTGRRTIARASGRAASALADETVRVRAIEAPLASSAGADAPPRADLRGLWRAVMRHKWAILGFAAAVTLLAAVAVSRATPIYRATAVVLVEAQERRSVSIDSVYSGVSNEREHLQTQVELAASREVLRRVVRAMRLADRPEFAASGTSPGPLQAAIGTLARGLSGRAAPAPQSAEDRIVDLLRLGMAVTPVKFSRLLAISFDSPDPKFAAEVANEVARAYIRADVEARMQITESTGTVIRERLGVLKARVDEAEQAVQAYREREGLLDSKSAPNGLAPRQLEDLTLRLTDARYKRLVAEQAWEQVRRQVDEPETLPLVQRDPEVQRARQREDDARRRLVEVMQQYGSDHPTYKAAAVELTRAVETVRRESRSFVEGLRRDWTNATATEKALEASLAQVRQTAQGNSRKEITLQELEREAAANRQVYQAFLSRLKETSATAGGEQPTARIAQPASVPGAPVSPRKPQTILIALLASLALGVVAALLGRRLDTRLRTVADVESRLGEPVLAAVPPLVLRNRADAADAADAVLRQPGSPFAEAIGTASTALMLSTTDVAHKVIAVASSLPGEGKSLIALNLATFQAQDQRVLLIEADLRQPRLRSVLRLGEDRPGLSELIVGAATPGKAIVPVAGTGLDVIVAGRVPQHPIHLLRSPAFARLVASLREQYDVVIIDTPPLQRVSDALVAGQHAHGFVLVAAVGLTPIAVARASVRRIASAGIPLFGVVLNHYDPRRARAHFGEDDVQGLQPYGRVPDRVPSMATSG